MSETYQFDERWLKYVNVKDSAAAARWFANEYGVHGEGVNSLNPLVPVTDDRQTRAEWEASIDYEAAVKFALDEVKKSAVRTYTETEYDAAMRNQVHGIVDAAVGKG